MRERPWPFRPSASAADQRPGHRRGSRRCRARRRSRTARRTQALGAIEGEISGHGGQSFPALPSRTRSTFVRRVTHGNADVRLLRHAGDMRRQDQVRAVGEDVAAGLRRQRLGLEHVERRAAQRSRLQGGGQCRLVDDAAARRVDREPRRASCEPAPRADQAARVRRKRHVQADDVGGRQAGRRASAGITPCRPGRMRRPERRGRSRSPSCRARWRACAVSRAIAPKPTGPGCLPEISRPLISALRGQRAGDHLRRRRNRRRAAAAWRWRSRIRPPRCRWRRSRDRPRCRGPCTPRRRYCRARRRAARPPQAPSRPQAGRLAPASDCGRSAPCSRAQAARRSAGRSTSAGS